MLNLKQLLIYVDNFSKNALRSLSLIKKGQSYSPDDQEDYGLDLWEMAGETAGRSFSDPLVLLSKMYDKSKEVGGGYAAIYKALEDFNNEYYTEINRSPYKDAVNDLINKVQNDLMRRAGGAEGLSKPDSPEVISELKSYWKELDTGISQQTLEGAPEEAINEAAGSAAEAAEAKAAEDAEREIAESGSVEQEFERAKEKGTKTKNLKVHRETATSEAIEPTKATPQRIAAEINKYHGLKAITDDRVVVEKINKLIPILNKYKYDTEQIDELEKQQILQSEAPDPELADQIIQLRAEIDKSRREIARVKLSIRDHELKNKAHDLKSELQTTLSLNEKIKLQEKIDYYNLLSSGDVGTREETSKRRALLKLMKTRMPSPDELKKIKEDIAEAAKKKKPRTEYYAMQGAKIKGKFEPGEEGSRFRGAPKDFEAIIIKLSQTIASQYSQVKKAAIDPSTLSSAVQSYKDAAMRAAELNDVTLMKSTAKALNKAMIEQVENTEPVKKFKELLVAVYNFRDQAKTIEKTVMTNNDPLDEKTALYINDLIQFGEQIKLGLSNKQYCGPIVSVLNLALNSLKMRTLP